MKFMKPVFAGLFGLAITATSPAFGEEQPGGYLANPSVRLWYTETGRLSDNVLSADDFQLWNTVIGEGSAEEYATDALFTIDVRSDGHQYLPETLMLTATDSEGKVLAQRSYEGILTGEGGNGTFALWVQDAGCAGRVTFRASFGASTRTSTLDFDCGE